MADKKISALTGATTPLAGTEVLPIVQSSTTVKVAVSDLTAGRSVAGLNFIPSGSTVPTNGMYLPAANTVAVATNSTVRMTYSSAGNVWVNSTAAVTNSKEGFAAVALDATGPAGSFQNSAGAASAAIECWNTATTGDNRFITFTTDGYVTRGSVTYNRAGGLTAYNVTSDYRAKDISGPVTNSGALIDSIPVYMGTMKGATQERPMFIAHETPNYAHTGEKDAVDAEGNPVYQQMDASALIPVMWAELQSLRQRLATLEVK